MQTFSATEAKAKLGLILDKAQRGPVTIEKQGRPYAVVLSQEEYGELEDAYWSLKVREAKAENKYSSVEEAKAFLGRQ